MTAVTKPQASLKLALDAPVAGMDAISHTLAEWLPDNTVSDIEKPKQQSGNPHRSSRSRNSLATVARLY